MLALTHADGKKTKHIVFDFDGVIADTDTARYKTLAKILLKYNINLETAYNQFDIVGIPTDIFLLNNFPSLNKEQINKIVEKRRNEYLVNLREYCIVYPNAVQTIHDLKAKGYLLYLATTNESLVAQRLMTYIGIRHVFNTCFFRDDIVNETTNKKDYRLFLAKMNFDPKTIIIIEDSIIGIQSAKDNSIFCIAFNRNEDQVIKNLADISVKTYDDLRQIFGI